MSALTKVFVLVVSVLAIFLCGVVVTFVATTENYRLQYEEQLALTNAALAQAAAAEDALASGLKRRDAMIDALKQNIKILETQNADYMRRWSLEAIARVEADGKSGNAVQAMQTMQRTIQDMYTSQKVVQTELDAAHRQELTAQTQAIDLQRELEREKVKSDQLDNISQMRLEKVNELEDENARIRQKLQEVTLASTELKELGDQVTLTTSRQAGVPIRGLVTDIDSELASISVGSSSGVRKDMKFLVVRGNHYLGDLIITHVEATESAGKLIQRKGTVVIGDTVMTGFD